MAHFSVNKKKLDEDLRKKVISRVEELFELDYNGDIFVCGNPVAVILYNLSIYYPNYINTFTKKKEYLIRFIDQAIESIDKIYYRIKKYKKNIILYAKESFDEFIKTYVDNLIVEESQISINPNLKIEIKNIRTSDGEVYEACDKGSFNGCSSEYNIIYDPKEYNIKKKTNQIVTWLKSHKEEDCYGTFKYYITQYALKYGHDYISSWLEYSNIPRKEGIEIVKYFKGQWLFENA